MVEHDETSVENAGNKKRGEHILVMQHKWKSNKPKTKIGMISTIQQFGLPSAIKN